MNHAGEFETWNPGKRRLMLIFASYLQSSKKLAFAAGVVAEYPSGDGIGFGSVVMINSCGPKQFVVC